MVLFKKTKEKVNAAIASMDAAIDDVKRSAVRMEQCERAKVDLLSIIALGVITLCVQSFRD